MSEHKDKAAKILEGYDAELSLRLKDINNLRKGLEKMVNDYHKIAEQKQEFLRASMKEKLIMYDQRG